jgi:enterochelin esterase-like enzyme
MVGGGGATANGGVALGGGDLGGSGGLVQAGGGGASGGSTAGAGGSAGNGVMDPGTDGDGDFVIGPDYTDAPELTRDPAAPQGRVFAFEMDSHQSTLYPGSDALDPPGPFMRGVWVYVPAQYVDGTVAPLVVAQDGGQYGTNGRGYRDRLPVVLDNLIFAKQVPVQIAVMINPGPGDGRGSERGLEYDTVSRTYSDFIETEALPAVRNDAAIHAAYPGLRFTDDPEARATLGCSSGAAASFTMGWFTPERYRRLTTYSGTFVSQDPNNPIYPHGAWSYGEFLIAETPVKPLRVFLSAGENDNNLDSDPRFNNDMMHNWLTANQMVASALKAQHYHYRFIFAKGAGHCDDRVQAQTLPDTLRWIWRGYPI